MKKIMYLFSVIALCMMLFAGNASAVPFPTPDPIPDPTNPANTWTFGADVDDSGIFRHSSQIFTIELLDLGDLSLLSGGGAVGNSIGFYFEGANVADLSNLHGIFDISDITAYPVGPISQAAIVDFNQGKVFDVDDGLSVQSSFSGSGNIGFAILPDPTLGIPILFTEPFLNPGGVDISGTFPLMGSSLPDPYLFTFNLINPLTLQPTTFAAQVAAGVTPIPEPGTLLLVSSGLASILFYRKKKR